MKTPGRIWDCFPTVSTLSVTQKYFWENRRRQLLPLHHPIPFLHLDTFQVPSTKSTDHCTKVKRGTTQSSNLFVNVFFFNEKWTKLRGIKCPNDYQSFSCKLEGTQDTCQDKLPNMSWCLSCLLADEVNLVAFQFARTGRNSRLNSVCSLTSSGGRPGGAGPGTALLWWV